MATPTEVSNQDIRALTDAQLVHLLRQLVYLELQRGQINHYDSQVSLSIYIKDGGIDGLARWNDGPGSTFWLPSRNVGFQAKATDMAEAACEKEVRTQDGYLKPQVRKLVEAGGDYILFLGRDCVEQSKISRIQALENGILNASLRDGEAALTVASVRILDASDIAAWTNQFPAAVSQVAFALHRGSPGEGWEERSLHPPFEFPYVESEATTAKIVSIRDSSRAPRSVTRIIGPSGLGKSRLILEAFRPPQDRSTDPGQQALSSALCYVHGSTTQNIVEVVTNWRRNNCSGVIVVDDCVFELHEKLLNEVTRTDSNLSLITLGNDIDDAAYAGTGTKLVHVEPSKPEEIQALLERAFPELSEADRKFIAFELAQGYPLMAILVAQARMGNAPLHSRLTPDVLAKMLGRPVEQGSVAEKVISICALFEYLGVDGDRSHEREFVRSTFCANITADDFHSNIVEFQKTGAMTKYGRLVQVRPRPLAIRLAADWWQRCTPELALTITGSEFPAALATAFCERLRMLDSVPAVQETIGTLCSPQGPFGQAKVLLSELGSRLFRAMSEVNPVAAMPALSEALRSPDLKFEDVEGDVRRNLVQALETLALRAETFGEAVDALALFAASENEQWSNNASGILKRLFAILLSGTEANLEQRMPVLQALAESRDIRIRHLAVGALKTGLQTSHFTGALRSAGQGGFDRPQDYRPKMWKDVFDYWNFCLHQLIRLSASEDQSLAKNAATAIAQSIRGLLTNGRVDDVEVAIRTVRDLRGSVWPEAVDGIKQSLKYEGKGFPAEAKKRIESWLRLLEPVDLSGRLFLYVTKAGFEHEEGADGQWRDIAAEHARKLGVELASDWTQLLAASQALLVGSQNQAFSFGRGLADGMGYSRDAFFQLLEQLEKVPRSERNYSVLAGWLVSLVENSPDQATDLFEVLAAHPVWRTDLPRLTYGVPLNDSRTRVLKNLLASDVLVSTDLKGLAYGQAMAHVSADCAVELCGELLKRGIDGAWIALDIAFMYVHGDSAKWDALAPTMSAIVLTKGMLTVDLLDGSIDAHAFEVVANKLIPKDPSIAQALVSEVIGASESARSSGRGIDHCIKEILQTAFRTQLDASWPAVSEALLKTDAHRRWDLTYLLGKQFADADQGGLIGEVPVHVLVQWCEKEPQEAPVALAGMSQMVTTTGDSPTLTEIGKFLVDRYGDREDVLSELAANFHSFSWSGSLVPYYERQITVLSPLLEHRRLEVRRWSKQMIDSARSQIDRENEREEEHNAGRY